jgi:Ca2+-binding EF-hand superfamily protein
MLPILLDELVSKEDRTEDIRAMFKEADTDYSGFLSIDEMYACLLKMGADVTKQEVIDLFTEFDINGDMQIDIDEFVAIMSFGEEINF